MEGNRRGGVGGGATSDLLERPECWDTRSWPWPFCTSINPARSQTAFRQWIEREIFRLIVPDLGRIWRTHQASSDWSTCYLSRPGLVKDSKGGGQTPRGEPVRSPPHPDISANRPPSQGADGNACREGWVCYVTTYYARLLLEDGTGGDSERGFSPLDSFVSLRVKSSLTQTENLIGLQESKLHVAYLRWTTSRFGLNVPNSISGPETQVTTDPQGRNVVEQFTVHGAFFFFLSPAWSWYALHQRQSRPGSVCTIYDHWMTARRLNLFCWHCSLFLEVSCAWSLPGVTLTHTH